MDKPEEKKPNPPAGQPPRPPIGGKKPDVGGKTPMPGKLGAPTPKLPLPGQKPGMPPSRPGAPGLPGTPSAPGAKPAFPTAQIPGGMKPPQAGVPPLGPIKPPFGGAGKPPSLPGMPAAGGVPPLSPAIEKGLSEAEGSKADLQSKVADLEKRLMEEREKVLLASLRSKEEESISAKVETSIKDIQDKLRREKKEQELEEGRRKAETRLLEMERRLAEEREAWVQTLKTQLTQRDQTTQEMETHFSARLKDLEHRWGQEKSSLESAVKEREAELARIRQEMGLKAEQERGFWEDRLRAVTLEKEKLEREAERLRDRGQQDKDQLSTERQTLRDQVSRLESNLRMLEDQHRLERANLTRESESVEGGLKQQVSNLTQQLQTQTKDVMEKMGQTEALKSQNAAVNLQLEQFSGRLGDRERALDAMKGKLQDTEIEKERIQAALNHASQQRREAENQLEEQKSTLRNRDTALDEARRGRLVAEEELKARLKQHEDEIVSFKNEIAGLRDGRRDEIQRTRNEYEERIKAIQARLDPFELNANKIYNEEREKVRKDFDELRAQLEEANRTNKESVWGLDSQVKTLQDELGGATVKLQQSEDMRVSLEQELKQRQENRSFDQQLLEERTQEIERLTANFEAVRKAFEAQKIKIPALNKEIEDLKKMVHEKGLKTNEEFETQLKEKNHDIERLQQSVRELKSAGVDGEKKEDLFKEKEKVLRQMIQDKETTANEFKSRVHQLERRIDEFAGEREEVKAAAKKEVERMIQLKDRELEERLAAEKETIMEGLQGEMEKAKFRAAQEAVEKVRAEMPAVSDNPDLIRQEVEREMMSRIQEKDIELEKKVKEVQDAAKKDLDKFRWENESMKEELKKAREARAQIEREAQELLQQADDHYRSQLEIKASEIKDKASKKKGLFTSIGKLLDTPIVDFSKKDKEDQP